MKLCVRCEALCNVVLSEDCYTSIKCRCKTVVDFTT